MMIMFQNKIIYMPGIPPNARREKLSDYRKQCAGITWREERTKSVDGTEIALCVGSVGPKKDSGEFKDVKTVYTLYFQGWEFEYHGGVRY